MRARAAQPGPHTDLADTRCLLHASLQLARLVSCCVHQLLELGRQEGAAVLHLPSSVAERLGLPLDEREERLVRAEALGLGQLSERLLCGREGGERGIRV